MPAELNLDAGDSVILTFLYNGIDISVWICPARKRNTLWKKKYMMRKVIRRRMTNIVFWYRWKDPNSWPLLWS